MNSYEFVKKALATTGYRLEKIINLTGRAETDWLEFKAALKAQTPEEALKTNGDDYAFNLVKALVAMMNTSGGVVILGVDDHGTAVGLDKSGFTGDKDAFVRRVFEQVLLKRKWKPRSGGHWSSIPELDHSAVVIEWGEYQSTDVLIFSVKPRTPDAGPVVLRHEKSPPAGSADYVFMRAAGDIGRLVRHLAADREKWAAQNKISVHAERFGKWILKLEATDRDVYQSAVSEYCSALRLETENLVDRYVPLFAEAESRVSNTGQNREKRSDAGVRDNRKRTPPQIVNTSLRSLIKRTYPSFIVGDPGSGKTTSLLVLAREINDTESPSDNSICLYVPLSEYTASGLRDLICRYIRPLKWADIRLGLLDLRLTLFLDGLNECPLHHIRQCETEISDLLKEHPKAKIFVATRNSQIPFFAQTVIRLCPMTTADQIEFVQKYFSVSGTEQSALMEELRRLRAGYIIARSPLLLKITIEVWRAKGRLPDGMAELYRQFVEMWLEREIQKDRDAGSIEKFSVDELVTALALLAFSMRCDGFVTCTKTYAVDRLKVALGGRASVFVERLAQGLIVEARGNQSSMRFAHESIQEFFAALFLTMHSEHDLLESVGGIGYSRWLMPIVFAFELQKRSAEHFVEAAWEISPLIVAAALRDDVSLSALPEPRSRYSSPQDNLWLRGVLRCLRGEAVGEITESISLIGRTPSPGRFFQKHPLPEELISTLESSVFWYALRSHSQGRTRDQRLQHLFIDQADLWIELLPYALRGNPYWLAQISGSQSLIVGGAEDNDRQRLIDQASVSELCHMARNGQISDTEFRGSWKNALYRRGSVPPDSDLLALLTTGKVNADQFNAPERSALKRLWSRENLSPRILHVLVRDRIVKPEVVRADRVVMQSLLERVSPIRAKQLIKDQVLRTADFTDRQVMGVLSRVKREEDIKHVLEAGIVRSRQAIPKSILFRAHQKPDQRPPKSMSDRPETGASSSNLSNRTSSEILDDVYLTAEQALLKKVRAEVVEPRNFHPGSGYAHTLAEYINASPAWPVREREALFEIAEKFISQHGSKKQRKNFKVLLKAARDQT